MPIANIEPVESLTAEIKDIKIIAGGGVPYTGDYTVTPKAREGTTLKTKDKVMTKDVNVLEIPYFDVSNESGTTIYIASEVN